MKTIRKSTPLLLLFLCFSISIMAQNVTIYENDYSFEVDSDAWLNINSNFTDVTVSSWDRNEVIVNVYAETRASSSSKSDRLMEKIRIDVNGSKAGVEIESKLNKGSNTDKSEFEIRIDIKAPKSLRLDFDCQFGDVTIPTWDGRCNLEMQFGDLKITGLTYELNEIELQYSSLDIENVVDLEVSSSFSKVFIHEARNLEVDSQYDEFDIDKVVKLNADFQFSDLEVGLISKRLILDTQYGSVEIDEISKGFEKIVIDNQFGEVKAYINSGASYSIDVEMSFASFNCKDKSSLNYKKEGFNAERYWGQIGSGGGTVEITSSFGGVRLK